MREIKFRAWDKQNKRWANLPLAEYGFVWDEDRQGAWLTAGETIEHGTHDEFNEFELVQYTGLRDKNGVEIYEGDILRWKDNEPPRVFEYIEPVEFHDACFYLRGHWASSVGEIVKDEQELVEVVGNIYENPELLEGEK